MSGYERLGNSSIANMQQQQHQPQMNPNSNRNTGNNSSLNTLMGRQTPNQYGSNENLQMTSHSKSAPLGYRVPIQQQQQNQPQTQIVNMNQGQRSYLKRHHQSIDSSNQQIQMDSTSGRIDSRNQLQYQNYSYQSNYNQNAPSYPSSHQMQQRLQSTDALAASDNSSNVSSGSSSGFMDSTGAIPPASQYRNRQVATGTPMNINPQVCTRIRIYL